MIKDRDTTIGYHCPFCGISILHTVNIFSMSGNLIKLKCVCGSSELIVQTMKDHKYKITVPCILCPNSHSFTLSSGTFFQKDLFPFTCKFTAINICFIGKYGKVHEALKKNEEELMKTFAAYEEEYGGGNANNPDGDLLYLDDENYYYYDDDEEEPDDYFTDSDIDDDYYGFDGFDNFDDFDDLDEFDEFDELDDFNNLGDVYVPGEREPEYAEYVLYKNKNYRPESETESESESESGETANISGLNSLKIGSYQIVSQILDSIIRLYTEKMIFCKCGDFDGKIVILDKAVHIECQKCGSARNIRSATISDADYMSGIDVLYLDFDD